MGRFLPSQVGERIRVILDCDDNTLSFEKNYEFLGVAFRGMYSILSRQDSAFNSSTIVKFAIHCQIINCLISGLPDKKLYPTVSAVYGNTEVSMVYLGPPLDG